MKIVSILWFLWALSSSNGFNVKDVISNIRKFEDGKFINNSYC